MEKVSQKQKKKQIKLIEKIKKHKKIIVMLLLLCGLIYIIYSVVKLIKNPADTVYVEMGQIEEEETTVGYVIRDEIVLKGENYKNGIEQKKTEGEKVAKGEAIFRYYSNDEEDLVEKIKALDVKIDEAMLAENPLSSDTKVLEEQIDSKINQLYEENNLKIIQNYK